MRHLLLGSADRRPRAFASRALLVMCALCALALAACSGDRDAETPAAPESGRSWPADTVLAVEDVPITATEVDRDSLIVLLLMPNASERELRRKALIHMALPRAIGRALGGERRAAVEEEARARRAGLAEDLEMGPFAAQERRIGYGDYHLALWGAALDTEVGAWTPVVEVGGSFAFARVDERFDHALPAATEFSVTIFEYPYLAGERPPSLLIEDAHDDLKLTIIDPAWEKVVPERTKYRMGVHK